MRNINPFRKLKAVLGIKGLLCLASLTVIISALVSYTAVVTITPTTQFSIGATTASWTVYVNDMDQVRYLPGTGTPAGSQQPSAPSDADPNTFAFKVVTDADRVCAVKIELTTSGTTRNSRSFRSQSCGGTQQFQRGKMKLCTLMPQAR
jgi:hypothetical protein